MKIKINMQAIKKITTSSNFVVQSGSITLANLAEKKNHSRKRSKGEKKKKKDKKVTQ